MQEALGRLNGCIQRCANMRRRDYKGTGFWDGIALPGILSDKGTVALQALNPHGARMIETLPPARASARTFAKKAQELGFLPLAIVRKHAGATGASFDMAAELSIFIDGVYT